MLTAHDLLRLSGAYSPAARYLEARRRAHQARRFRARKLREPSYNLPLLRESLDRAVEEAEALEARALASLEAAPGDRWELGGGVGLERVTP